VAAAVLLVSAFGFAGTSTAFAANAGTGPNDALAASGQWLPLAVGQQVWYAFQYAGDGSQILARMSVVPTGIAGFEIWTPAEYQQYLQGNTVTPVGRGSANVDFGGDLIWSGNFDTAGTYYVIVTETGPNPGNFSLSVTGDGVSYLPAQTATAAPASSTAPAASATPAAAPTASAMTGTGPNNALPIAGQWTPLAVGQQVWYSFQYPGDGSQVTLAMSVDPAGAAGFEVWTPAEFQQYLQGNTVTPVGRGSVDNAISGDLVWSGNFDVSGTFYVIVSQTGPNPANFMLAFH